MNKLITLFLVFAVSLSAEFSSIKEVGEDNSESPKLGIDGQGNAVAIWLHNESAGFCIQAASRPVGGNWSEPVTISISDRGVSRPKLVVDKQGNAVAVWSLFDGTTYTLESATLPSGSEYWIPTAEPLSGPTPLRYHPQLSVGKEGSILACWAIDKEGKTVIESSRLKIESGFSSWLPLESLSTENEEIGIKQIKFDSMGNATMLWVESSRKDLLPKILKVATLALNESRWGAEEALYISPKGDLTGVLNPQLEIDPQGKALALWVKSDDALAYSLQAASKVNGQSWREQSIPTAEKVQCSCAILCMDDSGNATFIWQPVYSETKIDLLSSQLLASSEIWTEPIEVFPSSEPLSRAQAVNVDQEGNVILISFNYTYRTIKEVSLPFGSTTWTDPIVVSKNIDYNGSPGLAFAPNGNYIIFFSRHIDVVSTIDSTTGTRTYPSTLILELY